MSVHVNDVTLQTFAPNARAFLWGHFIRFNFSVYPLGVTQLKLIDLHIPIRV